MDAEDLATLATCCIVKADRLDFWSYSVVPSVVMWYVSIGLQTVCHCFFIKFIIWFLLRPQRCELIKVEHFNVKWTVFSCSFVRSIFKTAQCSHCSQCLTLYRRILLILVPESTVLLYSTHAVQIHQCFGAKPY